MTDVQFLTQLPSLTDLDLADRSPNPELFFDPDPDPAVDLTDLVDSLRRCTQITQLTLRQFNLIGRHLEDLLPALPLLSRLTLQGSELESLRCFATPALASSLQSLQLRQMPRCPPSELIHLFGLRSLRRLLIQGLSEGLSPELLAEFRDRQRFPFLPD